jgi:hypothetical protein
MGNVQLHAPSTLLNLFHTYTKVGTHDHSAHTALALTANMLTRCRKCQATAMRVCMCCSCSASGAMTKRGLWFAGTAPGSMIFCIMQHAPRLTYCITSDVTGCCHHIQCLVPCPFCAALNAAGIPHAVILIHDRIWNIQHLNLPIPVKLYPRSCKLVIQDVDLLPNLVNSVFIPSALCLGSICAVDSLHPIHWKAVGLYWRPLFCCLALLQPRFSIN